MSDDRPKLSGAQALYPLTAKPEDLHRAATYQARQIERGFETDVALNDRLKVQEEWKKDMEKKHAEVENRVSIIETDNKVNRAVSLREKALLAGLVGAVSFFLEILVQIYMHH